MKHFALKPILIAGICIVLFPFFMWALDEGTVPKSVEVTYLGNCGFLVRVGDKKILFDVEGVEASVDGKAARTTFDALKAGRSPFDGLRTVLISHAHADHIGFVDFAGILAERSVLKLYSTDDTRNEMKKIDPDGFKRYAENVIVLDPFQAGILKTTIDGIEAEILGFSHAGAPQYVFKDLSFALVVDGVRILYLSDIDPGYEKNLAVLRQWAGRGRAIDLLFAPAAMIYPSQWVPRGFETIMELIKPGRVIAMHLNPKAMDDEEKKVKAHFPEAVFFRTVGESRIIQ